MGFDYNGIKLLLHLKSRGVNFNKTVTIGRQGLYVDAKSLENLFEKYYHKISSENCIQILNSHFSEPFLNNLGATQIDSLDASDYESATVIHDMNTPISEHLKNQYDVLIDGGALEHIFNFPTAIKNCMELIKEGGYFISLAPANNYFGHGFYQFSPELFFRVFSLQNGFEIENVIHVNMDKRSNWFEVMDPDIIKKRVTFRSASMSSLFVVAKRVAIVPIFKTIPQQSDYQHILWKKNNFEPSKESKKTTLIMKLFSRINYYIDSFRDLGSGDKFSFRKIKW